MHLAGKYCESGDILVDRATLPKTKPGDIIALLATGHTVMRWPQITIAIRPAVVFVENGQAKLVVKRGDLR